MTRFVRALEAIGRELQRHNDCAEASAADERKTMEVLTNLQALQAAVLREQQERRVEEREHMKVCERRYRQTVADGVESDPVKH